MTQAVAVTGPFAANAARIALVLGAAMALSGCVAAAIPVLAAGGLVRTQTDGKSDRDAPQPRVALPAEAAAQVQSTPAPVRNASADEPAAGANRSDSGTSRDYAFSDGSRVTVTNTLARPSASGESATPAAPVAVVRSDFRGLPSPVDAIGPGTTVVRLTGLTDLPPPSSARAAGSTGGWAPLAAYVSQQAAIPVVGSERRSAILADSAALSAETRSCSIHPAAVLIDLDPAGGLVEPLHSRAADPALAASLASLRREEVVIGWTSGRTADRAGSIRAALRSSGLDPEGRDELVLLRFPEENKQTRRLDFAKSHCVVAIAGDERADFDELYTYLRDPAAAASLEKLIGAGWFIVPAPLPN